MNIINTILALASMGLAAASAMIWMQPEYPSRVDPRGLKPEARALETTAVDRPTLEPKVIEDIMTANLFRSERKEYVPPPPPVVASAAPAAPAAPTAVTLPAPNVALRGVFLANGTQVAFLEGKYPVLASGQIQEKPLKRKGYYLGDAVGQYRIKSINKTQVSLSSPRGSIMTVSMPKREQEQIIQRTGTHFHHKDKDARKNRQVEVEKIVPVPRPLVRPPGPPSTGSPSASAQPVPPAPAQVLKPAPARPRRDVTPQSRQRPALGVPVVPRISGVPVVPRRQTLSHISGAR